MAFWVDPYLFQSTNKVILLWIRGESHSCAPIVCIDGHQHHSTVPSRWRSAVVYSVPKHVQRLGICSTNICMYLNTFKDFTCSTKVTCVRSSNHTHTEVYTHSYQARCTNSY